MDKSKNWLSSFPEHTSKHQYLVVQKSMSRGLKNHAPGVPKRMILGGPAGPKTHPKSMARGVTKMDAKQKILGRP